MKKAIHNISTGEIILVDCADSEITYSTPAPIPAPTKDQLMAQLAALSAQIQALE